MPKRHTPVSLSRLRPEPAVESMQVMQLAQSRLEESTSVDATGSAARLILMTEHSDDGLGHSFVQRLRSNDQPGCCEALILPASTFTL
jgi:hypothetical protein